jgi:hypothetical protein
VSGSGSNGTHSGSNDTGNGSNDAGDGSNGLDSGDEEFGNPVTASSSIPVQARTRVSNRTHYHDSDSDDADVDTDWSDDERIQFYQDKAEKYKSQRNKARDQRDEAATHVVLGSQHIQSLQTKLNAKKDKKGHNRIVNIGSRITSTQTGREEAIQQRTVREEKARKVEESKQRKLDAQVEVHARRTREGPTGMVFTGALSSQKRPALQDIAWSLGLAEDGTRDNLIIRIRSHFDADQN